MWTSGEESCLLLPESAAVVSCHLTWELIRDFAWQIRISHQEVKPESQTGFIKEPRSWHAYQCGLPRTLPALLKVDVMKAEMWSISADQVWSLESPEEAPLERCFKLEKKSVRDLHQPCLMDRQPGMEQVLHHHGGPDGWWRYKQWVTVNKHLPDCCEFRRS